MNPEGVDEFEEKITMLLRKPFPVQTELIKGIAKALYKVGRGHLFITGEMGCGKTMIALSTVFMSSSP